MRSAGHLLLVLITACTLEGGGLGSGSGVPGTTSATAGTSTGTVDSSTTEPDPGTSTTATATATTTSADETTTTSVSEGSESSGSTGDPEVPPLDDTGLVARWFIDEAATGQMPTQVLDATEDPVDLDIQYHNVMPAFVEVGGHRALEWPASADGGRAALPIAGTKVFDELGGAQQATVELVLAVDSLANQTSRFFHIGEDGANGDLSVGSGALNEVQVRWDNASTGTYYFTADLSPNRQVLHVVIDTTQPLADSRIQAYINGTALPLSSTGNDLPAQGEGLPLLDSSSVVLGNRTSGARSFDGRLHYAAVYSVALSPSRIQNNADALGVSDDSP